MVDNLDDKHTYAALYHLYGNKAQALVDGIRTLAGPEKGEELIKTLNANSDQFLSSDPAKRALLNKSAGDFYSGLTTTTTEKMKQLESDGIYASDIKPDSDIGKALIGVGGQAGFNNITNPGNNPVGSFIGSVRTHL